MKKPDVAGTTSPQCPTCGYSLLGLTEHRCPECGDAFDPEYVDDAAFRSNLLPWERPETGSILRRLWRTLAQASLRPGRFYVSASRRSGRRIDRPHRLIAAFVLMSFCFFLISALLGDAAFFLRLVINGAMPAQALAALIRLNRMTWSFELIGCGLQVLSVLLCMMLVATLIKWKLWDRIASFQWIDLVALLCPAVATGGLVAACALVAAAALQSTSAIMGLVAFGGQPVVVLVLLWCCCRQFLLLSRKGSAGMLLAGGGLLYGSSTVVGGMFWLIGLW